MDWCYVYGDEDYIGGWGDLHSIEGSSGGVAWYRCPDPWHGSTPTEGAREFVCPECGRTLPEDGIGNGYCERRSKHPSGERVRFVPADPVPEPRQEGVTLYVCSNTDCSRKAAHGIRVLATDQASCPRCGADGFARTFYPAPPDTREGQDVGEAVLDWRCETCGWTRRIAMPGFAGDGYRHYRNGQDPCGPLVARRAPGFLRGERGDHLGFEQVAPAPASRPAAPAPAPDTRELVDAARALMGAIDAADEERYHPAMARVRSALEGQGE